jgi:hypothetical protein
VQAHLAEVYRVSRQTIDHRPDGLAVNAAGGADAGVWYIRLRSLTESM